MRVKKEIQIKNESGLHARPAALFVQIANKFECEIVVQKDKQKVNGKSIMGIMMLAAERGSSIMLFVDGDDAEDAARELEELLLSDKIEEGLNDKRQKK